MRYFGYGNRNAKPDRMIGPKPSGVKRYKRIFSTISEVTHVWAQQSQPDGQSGNVYFSGTKLYSYGSHFVSAEFHKRTHGIGKGAPVVLINSRRYSRSTGGHLNEASSAVSHLLNFEVPVPTDPKDERNFLHLENKAVSAMENLLNKNSFRWASPGLSGLWWVADIDERMAIYNKYVECFGAPKGMPKVLSLDEATRAMLIELVESKIARTMELKAIKDARTPDEVQALRAKKDRARAKKFQADRELWIQGGTNSTTCFSRNEVFCRIIGDEVQTSRGARVPLSEALTLVKKITKGQKVKGFKIGHYTVNSIDKENLFIGCHIIPLTEVKRLFGSTDATSAASQSISNVLEFKKGA